jgi:hypothetical protein
MLKKIAGVRRNKIISCNLKKKFQFHKINYARFTNALSKIELFKERF